ncbi:hypothetical protein KKF45_05755, partial [Patescibacteria group bacterium]|nr:hypothetical protein [Patescibacteria group bacterium]
MAFGLRKAPPLLSGLEIDVDKDWGGKIIKNFGIPVTPGDSVRLGDLLSKLSLFDVLLRRARKAGADWTSACCVAWSPDGKYLAMASVDADAVEVAEFTGTDLVRIVRKAGVDWNGAYCVAWSPDGKYLAMA